MEAQPERVPGAVGFGIGAAYQGVVTALTAPFLRANLILQTQDANPRVISGEIPRYRGLVDYLRRTAAEDGLASKEQQEQPPQSYDVAEPCQPLRTQGGHAQPPGRPDGPVRDFHGRALCQCRLGRRGRRGIPGNRLPVRSRVDPRRRRHGLASSSAASLTASGRRQAAPRGVSGLYEGFPLSSMPSMVRVSVNLCVNDTLIRYNPTSKSPSCRGTRVRARGGDVRANLWPSN